MGCRCPDACEANRIYAKRRREGRIPPLRTDATGAARRLQALAVMGWTPGDLAPLLKITKRHIIHIRSKTSPQINISTAQKITDLYNQLRDTPGNSRYANHVTNLATQANWAPPIAWDDDNINDPTATPQHNAPDTGQPSDNDDIDYTELLAGRSRLDPMSEARRRLTKRAVAELTAKGMSAPQIAERLNIADRTVVRIRGQLATEQVTAA